jgi:hypothetical protein
MEPRNRPPLERMGHLAGIGSMILALLTFMLTLPEALTKSGPAWLNFLHYFGGIGTFAFMAAGVPVLFLIGLTWLDENIGLNIATSIPNAAIWSAMVIAAIPGGLLGRWLAHEAKTDPAAKDMRIYLPVMGVLLIVFGAWLLFQWYVRHRAGNGG